MFYTRSLDCTSGSECQDEKIDGQVKMMERVDFFQMEDGRGSEVGKMRIKWKINKG